MLFYKRFVNYEMKTENHHSICSEVHFFDYSYTYLIYCILVLFLFISSFFLYLY
jgi:hypothetical protein